MGNNWKKKMAAEEHNRLYEQGKTRKQAQADDENVGTVGHVDNRKRRLVLTALAASLSLPPMESDDE